jgi:hypothetical protein
MSHFGVKQMACTLCGGSFRLVGGAMVHPADVLCNACVLSLYDRLPTEPLADLKAWCEARLKPRMGMMPPTLAQAIVDRLERLPEVVQSRAELEMMLANRSVVGG